MNKDFQHGDLVIATIDDQKCNGHIEERYCHQYPSKKRGLFFIFNVEDYAPRFPIPIETFLSSWGTLELKQSNTE